MIDDLPRRLRSLLAQPRPLQAMLYRIAYRSPLARKLDRCPICSSPGTAFRKIRFRTLCECTRCGHVYVATVPREFLLRALYSGMGYWYQDREHQGLRDIHEAGQWAGYIDSRIGILERTGILFGGSTMNIFEIGCSEGMLLRALADRGHHAEGCEVNRAIAALGRDDLSVSIQCGMFEKLPLSSGRYDLVVSYHTVEHLASPAEIVAKVARILKPSGSICLEVPTGEEEFDNLDHLHFFNQSSLQALLGRFFDNVELVDNSYVDSNGVKIGSVYGIGRRPRNG